MRVGITYFYHIRFFKPNQIPVATTLSMPPWYRKNGEAYIDKRGVVNGFRCTDFVPGRQLSGLCKGPEYKDICGGDPTKCKFLTGYRGQLEKLDINAVMDKFQRIADEAEKITGKKIDDPQIVLIVYEAFTNDGVNCSEAFSIIDYFKNNGIDIEIVKGNAKEDKLAKEKAKYNF